MSAGEIAGLIAACGFVLLVGIVAVPLLKLGQVLGETTTLVSSVTDQTVPLLSEVTVSVTHVNNELERVDAITANAQEITNNVSALTSVFAATLGGPLVKVAAFSYGVRRAMNARRKGDIERRVRQEMRAERRSRRRGA
jgi:predicted PurR-regulated permease PerM